MKDCDLMKARNICELLKWSHVGSFNQMFEDLLRKFCFGKFWEGTFPATSWLQRSSKTAWSDGKDIKVNFSATIQKERINHPRRAGRVCITRREKQVSGCVKTAHQERR